MNGRMASLASAAALACSVVVSAAIFPAPREVEMRGAAFVVDESVAILAPQLASQEDLKLARLLTAELSDRYGVALPTRQQPQAPASGRFIIMGAASNPLVKQACANLGVEVNATRPGPEGYVLYVDDRIVLVAGSDDAGAFYGLQSLRQLIEKTADRKARIPGVRVRDWPYKPYRGIKLYLPGHENVAYFKRFLRDFMALYKFNTVIVEMNAAMRFDRHPELNAGWIEFGKDMNYTRRERSWGPGRQLQDSANADTGDSGVLEKEEVAELVRYAREQHIDFTPEVPTLTHSYYLLARHRELAEIPDAEWPDTYCPSEPKTYDLVFDVLDEIVEVTKPRMVHVGHDEWRMPLGVCKRCQGKDSTELYAQDLNRIYSHLRQKNVHVAIYGDHLIEALRGKAVAHVSNSGGTPYDVPGGLSAEQVRRLIPKDILIYNWFWNDKEKGMGEANENALREWGFRQVYNNFEPEIQNYGKRSQPSDIIGGTPSSWAATNELNFGKDLMYEFLGCASLLWSTKWQDTHALSETVQDLLPGIRRRLGAALPSDDGPMIPVPMAPAASTQGGPDLGALKSGKISAGNLVFDVAAQPVLAGAGSGARLPREPAPIAIGADVSSIAFLHASEKPGGNAYAYTATWNFPDTADLLGWYEAEYEDGLIETIPIRYGVNILEAGWGQGHAARNVAYETTLLDCAKPGANRLTFFAFEWVNPRFGKVVKTIRLRGVPEFRTIRGRPAPQNSIILAGVSVVKKRVPPGPPPLRSYGKE